MIRRVLAFALIACLPGCAVGPDFVRPAAPAADRFLPEPLPEHTESAPGRGGESQRFVERDELPLQWWTLFNSPALDALVDRAIAANPGVQSAVAALRAARESTYAQQGVFFPQVSASVSPARERSADLLSAPLASGENPFTLHTAQLSIAYAPDVFGLNRRAVEALSAQEDYQRFQLDAAYLTLTTNVVVDAIQEASLRGQIEATRRIVDIETEQVGLMQRQLELGAIPEASLVAQQAQLAQAQAALPALEKQLGQQRNALATLVGRLPGEGVQEQFDFASLSLPPEVPLTLPSKLVDRRPDVRAAEAQLHAASAQIGVATANMLPQISLAAGAGSVAEEMSRLFTGSGAFWSVSASLAQPLFQGGTLLHRKRAAEAAYDQAAAQYRGVVLAAFQNVADALTALQLDARAMSAAARAESLALSSLDIVRRQYALGDVSYLAVLNAEQAWDQALIGRIQAQAGRYADTAALFQALGGGWTAL